MSFFLNPISPPNPFVIHIYTKNKVSYQNIKHQ